MNTKGYLYILGTVLILAFAGYAFTSGKDALTPYVSFDKARSSDRVVQVAGGLVPGSSSYDGERQALLFTLHDEATGDALRVRYDGVKPGNFEDAVSIVAIGRYQAQDSEFHADKLLVKCPSKYQGLDEGATETKTYG